MHTSIGRLLAVVGDREHYTMMNNLTGTNDEEARQGTNDVIRMLSGAAHYVADPKIVKLMGTDAAQATLDAMGKAGIRHLPFDPILIELTTVSSIGRTVHSFVRLQTKPFTEGRWWDDDGVEQTSVVDIYAYITQYQIDPRDPVNGILVASLPCNTPIAVSFTEDPERPFVVMINAHVMDHADLGDNPLLSMEYTMHLVVAEAMGIALMMLNTKGIDKVPVSTAKLNRARAKAGKRGHPPIGDYTVLRIGHVYDAYGKAHSVAGSGRTMPVHWRAGHVRNVPYGPLRAEARPTRLHFIPPCLVNFDPMSPDPAPMPKREVTV